MEHQINEIPETSSENGRKNLRLPLLALLLSLMPAILTVVSDLLPFWSLGSLSSIMMMMMILSPIMGIVVGVSALGKGKAVIGTVGKIIAIVAIALPLLVVGYIVLLFVGVMTGQISFM